MAETQEKENETVPAGVEIDVNIEDIINNVANQDFSKAQPTFAELMKQKVNDALEQEKIAVANQIFNSEEPEEAEEESEEDSDEASEDDEDNEEDSEDHIENDEESKEETPDEAA